MKRKLRLSWPPGQKEWIASAIVIVVCGSITGFVLTHTGDKPVASAKPYVKKESKTPAAAATVSNLTGLPVAPALNQRVVTGVMIENSPDSRPQSGLSQAGVVFEAIAEGGVTRFLALVQDTEPESVGPIRSARPYYAQWTLGFDATYAHVGGSPQALEDLKNWSVRDLDQFYNAGAYQRISSRSAPHNVYTSIGALNGLAAQKNLTKSTYTSFVRKKEAPAKTATAKSIDMVISGPTYNVHYDYNPGSNNYTRFEGGASHMDANGNVPITPKVVIGLAIPYSVEADGYHSTYGTIGSGEAHIFQDGTVTIGQWHKKSNADQITFTDTAGKPLGLNPGQTWITAVSGSERIKYAP